MQRTVFFNPTLHATVCFPEITLEIPSPLSRGEGALLAQPQLNTNNLVLHLYFEFKFVGYLCGLIALQNKCLDRQGYGLKADTFSLKLERLTLLECFA